MLKSNCASQIHRIRKFQLCIIEFFCCFYPFRVLDLFIVLYESVRMIAIAVLGSSILKNWLESLTKARKKKFCRRARAIGAAINWFSDEKHVNLHFRSKQRPTKFSINRGRKIDERAQERVRKPDNWNIVCFHPLEIELAHFRLMGRTSHAKRLRKHFRFGQKQAIEIRKGAWSN